MKNTVSISQPEGTYSIIYGVHVATQSALDIPKNIDAIVLETGTRGWIDTPLETLKKFRTHVQYKELFIYLEKYKIPIVFADGKYKYNDTILMLLDNVFSATEWIWGYKLLKKFRKDRNIGTLLLGSWFILPFLSNMLRLVSASTGIGMKQSGHLKKISHKLHPEADFLYLTFRNAIIVEKVKYLMRTMFGRGSHIATVLGAGHVGIEDILRLSDEARHRYFRHLVPFLPYLVDSKHFYTATVFTFSKGSWHVNKNVEVPSLKALL